MHFEGTFTDKSVPTVFQSKPVKQTKERRPLTRRFPRFFHDLDIVHAIALKI